MSDQHIHDCIGPDSRCPCGFVLRIPPVCCSFDVTDHGKVILSDGFNCEDIGTVVDALREWADKLEAQP